MIGADLRGGLGNQMFIIATAYSLALDNHDECAFNFNSKVKYQGNPGKTYKNTVYKKLKELPPNWKPKFTYIERGYAQQPIPYHKEMMLDGYFSQRYFSHHKKEIIELFKDRKTIDQIKGQFNNSVSIHVRRGDYLKFSKVYIQLPLEYYLKALSLLEKQVKIDRIYVFSDDIKWCKQNFKDDRIDFVEGLPDYIDLYAMTKCTHNIMANSSFSWWGAYLNENPNQIVYVPKKWFYLYEDPVGIPGPVDYEYLFCNNWLRL